MGRLDFSLASRLDLVLHKRWETLALVPNFCGSFFFPPKIYLFLHERHRERQRHRQREKQGPCREPDAGLDPRTPGSRLEPKADAQLLSHPGIPLFFFKYFIYLFMRQRERGRDTGRGRSRVPSGSPMWDWIPGPQDHTKPSRHPAV